MKVQVKDIALLVGGRVRGDGSKTINGINSLQSAGPDEMSFYTDKRFRRALEETRAGALLASDEVAHFSGPQIIVDNAQVAYAKAVSLFDRPIPRHPGVSAEASIHPSCQMGEDVSIYPGVFVGEDVVIGEKTVLFPGVFIGDRVQLGARTVIHPNVSVLHDCIVGNDVILHAGTVIGSDGFGFVRDGNESLKIPQIGIVQIDDHAEIGANNCIDRAALGRTWIQRGVKTDNLVQIAHNVVVGEGSLIVAQAGISGSVKIGRGVILGGQVGIADHLEIGDGAMAASQSGIMRSLGAGEIVSGTPAMPHREYMRVVTLMARLPKLSERVKALEKALEHLVGSTKEEA